jgi:hypothetical protein
MLCSMNVELLIAYVALGATLLNALLVRARVARVLCASCGQPFERHELGQDVCSCDPRNPSLAREDLHRQA